MRHLRSRARRRRGLLARRKLRRRRHLRLHLGRRRQLHGDVHEKARSRRPRRRLRSQRRLHVAEPLRLLRHGRPKRGKCAAPIASGGACVQSNNDCADGLVCTGTTLAHVRIAGHRRRNLQRQRLRSGIGVRLQQHQVRQDSVRGSGRTRATTTRFAARRVTCVQQATGGGSGGGSGTLSGTCPTIIADGQPCTGSSRTSQCDDFASCIEGKCVFVPAACK